LFAADYIPVCSPKLLSGEHPLRTPEDLRHHTLLHDDTVLDDTARPTWDDWLKFANVKDVDATRGPHFSDASLALAAAAAGLGVALAIKPLLCREIEAGNLVVPFDLTAPAAFAYFLVTPEPESERPPVVTFRNWLLAEAAKV